MEEGKEGGDGEPVFLLLLVEGDGHGPLDELVVEKWASQL
jgi:hypothetical protein